METPGRLRLLALAVAFLLPVTARANDQLDRGVALAHEAEFEAALEAFAAAEADGPLTRDELVTLLLERAQVTFALGDADAMRRDVARLAVLEPNLVLPPTSPPQLRSAFEANRGDRLGLAAEATRDDASVTITARPTGEARDLVREVRVSARVGDSPYEAQTGPEVRFGAPRDVRLEWYAELVGPGGAVLASEGDAEAPRAVSPVAPDVAVAPAEGGDDALAWGLGLGGAGVAVAAAVVVGVLFATQGPQQTLVTGPTVDR